jgi:hypothetical protein
VLAPLKLAGFLAAASMRNLLESHWVSAPQRSDINYRLDA